MRKPYVAGNWKMNLNKQQAQELARQTAEKHNYQDMEVGVAPPAVYIPSVLEAVKGGNIRVAAQNCHEKESGAFTGEISASMVKDIGCDTVILGHSERRHVFGETDERINAKVVAALAAGLNVILCIGETLQEREAGRTNEICERHTREGLKGVSAADMSRVVIAYEPVWAIGTGKTATPEQAQEVHAFVRPLVGKLYSKEVAEELRIQYGGSVKPDNTFELMSQPDIDGALVGGAALKADSFSSIITETRRAKGLA